MHGAYQGPIAYNSTISNDFCGDPTPGSARAVFDRGISLPNIEQRKPLPWIRRGLKHKDRYWKPENSIGKRTAELAFSIFGFQFESPQCRACRIHSAVRDCCQVFSLDERRLFLTSSRIMSIHDAAVTYFHYVLALLWPQQGRYSLHRRVWDPIQHSGGVIHDPIQGFHEILGDSPRFVGNHTD